MLFHFNNTFTKTNREYKFVRTRIVFISLTIIVPYIVIFGDNFLNQLIITVDSLSYMSYNRTYVLVVRNWNT